MPKRWILIASGPSMNQIDMNMVRAAWPDWRVMVINNSWQLAPWADVMYAGDAQWWNKYGDDVRFANDKYTANLHTAQTRNIKFVERVKGHGLNLERGKVNAGGNSGFAAINLAYHLGMRQAILLGYDMHRNAGAHWHGEHEGMLSAPESHIRVWVTEFNQMASDLRKARVRVINSTPGTALTCFPCKPLEKALDC